MESVTERTLDARRACDDGLAMLEDELERGLRMFNAGEFFSAHETLEDVWRIAPKRSRLRRHLQGLVQIAVAFHHRTTGNRAGAQSVLERALRNLDGAEESFPNLDLERLRVDLETWREILANPPGADRRQLPALPKITLHGGRLTLEDKSPR